MNVKKLTQLSLLLGLLVSFSALAMPAQVLIIRHAEKPDPEGRELSIKGFKRAKGLVNYFKTNKNVTKYGTPVAIYAMKPKDEEGSIRSIQTVTPLAADLGLQVLVLYKKNELKELVSTIQNNHQYDGKMVLICWEHKVIPDLATTFGVKPRPADWGKEDYSTVFEINFSGNDFYKFRKYNEVIPVLLQIL